MRLLEKLWGQLITVGLFAPHAVHLVDVWNMIEAFRDNGLNTLDHSAEINVSRLETILSSIYYQLNKRLPTTHQINVEQSIGLLLNFMVATYDRYGSTPGITCWGYHICTFVDQKIEIKTPELCFEKISHSLVRQNIFYFTMLANCDEALLPLCSKP